jgi:hypothetical protein
LIVWILVLTLAFLLLQSPVPWASWLDTKVPQIVDIRSALRSLVYRDFVY